MVCRTATEIDRELHDLHDELRMKDRHGMNPVALRTAFERRLRVLDAEMSLLGGSRLSSLMGREKTGHVD